MPENEDNPLSFWQELKRRKVVRVITVYAAAAYVVIELVSNIEEPLQLPDWTSAFIIVLLCIGFIITVILSWIYDITPAGIEKTKPVQEIKEKIPAKSSGINAWKIATILSVVVIIALIVLNIIPRTNLSGEKSILEKSIAVIPFKDDSPDKDNEHIINGIMEDLLINLQSIKELRVPGRTSTEQYRNNPKPIPEIADEMNVAYIVEGSGQRYGNKIRLRVQLVEGETDKHIWADSYDEVINGPEDIFRIQSQIAKSIATELQAVITPEEKQRIENTPTTSLTAYELYQKGQEEYWRYYSDRNNKEALDRAEERYRLALEFDPAYAKAYTGLAWVYWFKRFWVEYQSDECLDSVLMLANTALAYDDQLADGYVLKGNTYRRRDKREWAIKEYDKALKINSNNWVLYNELGWYYVQTDLVKSLDNFHRALSLIHGPELPTVLRRSLGNAYDRAGFPDKAEFYYLEALKLDGDSMAYYEYSAPTAYFNGNWEIAIASYEKLMQTDSTNQHILHRMGESYMYLGKYEQSLKYLEKWVTEGSKASYFWFQGIPGLAYVYLRNGFEKEADYHFRESIKHFNKVKEQAGSATDEWTYYGLAAAYAFNGEEDKAYENLRLFVKNVQVQYTLSLIRIKNDPLFDSIRNEPEFQQIVREVEAKYQAEHERVRKWLEENDML